MSFSTLLCYVAYMKYPHHLIQLIESLKRFPGVGNKSAERFAFQMLDWKRDHLHEMARLIQQIPEKLKSCDECGCLIGDQQCEICQEPRTQSGVLCIIASAKDAFAIEETREYKGLYHVIGGLLSPLEGRGPDQLNLFKIKDRVIKYQIQEVIIALDSTLEGDTTALYIKKELGDLPVNISRLALGLPMGSSLDYVDGGTLARAFSGRGSF